jgi:hypothetical protein
LASEIPICRGKVNLSKRVWEKLIQEDETHSAESDKMTGIPAKDVHEPSSIETAPNRKVVQISTMVHPEKDWAFVALCDDGSLWLYHGSWSQIENIPQTSYW